jgi:hypothetical protein
MPVDAPIIGSAIALPEPRSKVLPVSAVVSRANREVDMPVEEYDFARVSGDLEVLQRRVRAIEDARREEQDEKWRQEKEKWRRESERSQRQFYVILGVYWVVIAAAWSAIITAVIVGD